MLDKYKKEDYVINSLTKKICAVLPDASWEIHAKIYDVLNSHFNRFEAFGELDRAFMKHEPKAREYFENVHSEELVQILSQSILKDPDVLIKRTDCGFLSEKTYTTLFVLKTKDL